MGIDANLSISVPVDNPNSCPQLGSVSSGSACQDHVDVVLPHISELAYIYANSHYTNLNLDTSSFPYPYVSTAYTYHVIDYMCMHS